MLRECIDETERGGRLQSALNLVELFRADFDDGEDHGVDTGDEDLGGEQDYENGNAINQEEKKGKEQETTEKNDSKLFLPPNLKLEKGGQER